ncbi:MAG: 30S ribosomal protein S9 [Candidatus Magnetoglobus multicellularis str. Araruama]|uniref:Small ribosomal subunit protein uS9 n=1 Tax=Candidatus Magnetoglobus multicellularis str. Araruama TaxID=890399 RepID=A0A1V1PI02_9BACT|nr:MAG: 30S ribosomal protein S9 [Candidatus Magnetoglobus multicellularis str. Araruama]
MSQEHTYYATGRRKNAIARTFLSPGDGKIVINKRPLDDYFKVETAKMLLMQPFELTGTTDKFDVTVTVKGGGISGQAGAVRHGITRALEKVNPEFRRALKKAGFISRDDREKERKKYGQRGARARYQFSKR